MLMRTIVLMGLAAAMAFPATAFAHQPRPPGYAEAAQACKEEREADPAAFREKYANEEGRYAFRRCVRRHLRAAVEKCREEREADPEAFREKYANEGGRRAFRRCVRQHAGDPVE